MARVYCKHALLYKDVLLLIREHFDVERVVYTSEMSEQT